MKPHESTDSVGSMAAGVAADEGAASWGPIGPDGVPVADASAPPPLRLPPYTPENVPCLRQCRHYMHAVCHFDHGNRGLVKEPIEHREFCTALPGVLLELTRDSPAFECNRWNPLPPKEVSELEHAREMYFQKHPGHRPTPIGDPLDDEDEDEDDEEIETDDEDEDDEDETGPIVPDQGDEDE